MSFAVLAVKTCHHGLVLEPATAFNLVFADVIGCHLMVVAC